MSCALNPSTLTPNRQLFMRQSIALYNYGWQVVTTRPVYTLPTTVSRMFTWTQPFTAATWLLFAASLLVNWLAMLAFEGGGTSDDFSSQHVTSLGEKLGHGLYLSLTGPTVYLPWSPTSAAGRVCAQLQARARAGRSSRARPY